MFIFNFGCEGDMGHHTWAFIVAQRYDKTHTLRVRTLAFGLIKVPASLEHFKMKTLRRFAHKLTILGLSRPYLLSCLSILTAFHHQEWSVRCIWIKLKKCSG
jgi:hypothetical protein